jgi:hypothetical protein
MRQQTPAYREELPHPWDRAMFSAELTAAPPGFNKNEPAESGGLRQDELGFRRSCLQNPLVVTVS